MARDRCPKCGGPDLYARQTQVVTVQGQSKFDIYCKKCGYVATGNAVNSRTGAKIKDEDIRGDF